MPSEEELNGKIRGIRNWLDKSTPSTEDAEMDVLRSKLADEQKKIADEFESKVKDSFLNTPADKLRSLVEADKIDLSIETVLTRLMGETEEEYKQRRLRTFYDEDYYPPTVELVETDTTEERIERTARFFTLGVADLACRLRAFLLTKGGQVLLGPEVEQIFTDSKEIARLYGVLVEPDHIMVRLAGWISPIDAHYEKIVIAQGDYQDKKWHRVFDQEHKIHLYRGSQLNCDVQIKKPTVNI